jgi:hypothetical protein
LVNKGAQVPVDVVREHDWSGFVEGDGDQSADPCCVVCESVRCQIQDVAREARLMLVVERESDAVSRA